MAASASLKQKEIMVTTKRMLKNSELSQSTTPSSSVENETYLNVLLQQVVASTLEAERAVDSALTFINESNRRIDNLFRRDNAWV